jgi:uncharacterized protein YndB with AHSA1/START domain
MRKNDEPIVVEQTFDKPMHAVWKTITEIGLMHQWFFDNIPSFEPKVGFETQFNVRCRDRDFLHLWKVTEVVPGKMITYNWKYEGYAGDSFVTFELSEKDNLTKLRLTHQVEEDFPDDIPEFTRESCLEGWTYFIKDRLKDFLGKRNKV